MISNKNLTIHKVEFGKNEWVKTKKPEGISKMKCSICKQEGHNKRSCKTIVRQVSSQKLRRILI
jgi:hypothetical protein